MEKFNQLRALLEAIEEDAKKFYKNGTAAAGTRVRKAMQEMKVLAQDIRNEVTELKNKEQV